jgi:hypothetical protein
MAVKQHLISITEFAQALLEADSKFAERVQYFQTRFGIVDLDTLAVLAQATYFCWFEHEYERDYIEVCRAIGTGRPTSLFLCRQVTPARWVQMNTYVIAVQHWLGFNLHLTKEINIRKIEQIARWRTSSSKGTFARTVPMLHGQSSLESQLDETRRDVPPGVR